MVTNTLISMNFINFSTSPKVKTTRSSLACLPCRSRHLKCDSKQPCCNRCAESGDQCRYAASRRGGPHRAALAERRKQLPPADMPSTSSSDHFKGVPSVADVRQSVCRTDRYPEAVAPYSGAAMDEVCVDWGLDAEASAPENSIDNIEQDALINSYYANFHSFHPLLLPQRFLSRLYRDSDSRSRLVPLVGVMRIIGHLYSSQEWSTLLQTSVDAWLSQSSQTDPFMVQSRALYSIALFWHGHTADSEREMGAATRLALDLGMFRCEFAAEHGAGDPVLAESWRRTWWTLYIVDAYYAGTLGRKDMAVLGVETTVDLPCEESEYQSGVSYSPSLCHGWRTSPLDIDSLGR